MAVGSGQSRPGTPSSLPRYSPSAGSGDVEREGKQSFCDKCVFPTCKHVHAHSAAGEAFYPAMKDEVTQSPRLSQSGPV